MKAWDRLSGYFILVYAAALIYQSLDLSLGSPGVPGPGFLGFFLGVGLVAFSLGLILKNRGPEPPSRESDRKNFWRKGALVKPLAALAILACFVAMMKILGTFPTLFVFFLGWIKFLEKKGWGMAVLVSLFGTAGFFLIFGMLLRVPFPRGIFGQ